MRPERTSRLDKFLSAVIIAGGIGTWGVIEAGIWIVTRWTQ